jgi:hypothetical protein
MKVGRSKASLPLIVDYDKIPLTPLMRQKLEDHLVVVYTGKQVRMARLIMPLDPTGNQNESMTGQVNT